MERKQVKRLDFKTISSEGFETAKAKYYLEQDISVARYRVFEKYQLELAYGMDFETIHHNHANIINLIDKGKTVQAHAELHNMFTKFGHKLENRFDRAIRLCSLFILREGENPAEHDEKIEAEKIRDWEAEGISMNDFFTLAFNLIPGLLEALKTDFQDNLNPEQVK